MPEGRHKVARRAMLADIQRLAPILPYDDRAAAWRGEEHIRVMKNPRGFCLDRSDPGQVLATTSRSWAARRPNRRKQMAHSEFRNRLVALANANASNPGGFLEGLSDIHIDWHGSPVTYGFLLFHHRVVRYFKAIVDGPLGLGILPYSQSDLQPWGVPEVPGASGVDTLSELATYSTRIQSWHNGAHSRIGQNTGAPMMEPGQNIFFAPFWRLHFLIDDRFTTCLTQYANRAHPGSFVTLLAVASHIEAGHHTWVPRI
jgi:hypothetical protein